MGGALPQDGHAVAQTVDRLSALHSPAMTALLLALALTATPPCAGHVAPRNSTAKKRFTQGTPCPGGPDKGSTRHCQGYVIDHVCPLACCGLDAPQNMQWQTEADAKAKDKWEQNCSTCGVAQ
jgi:hypothetical protein